MHSSFITASFKVANMEKSLFFLNLVFLLYPILNQSSVDGRLSYFHAWAIVNSAAVNIEVHVSFWTGVVIYFPDIYPGVELLDHVVALFLVF